MTTRPAETLQGIVAAVIGAVTVLYGAIHDGLDFNDVTDLEVQGAVIALVGVVTAIRTWWIARRQRDPGDTLTSAPDGTVHG